MNAILKGKRGKKKKNKEEVEKGVRWHTVTVVFSLCSVLERFLAGFVLFCFVLFCFVLFCFVLLCIPLFLAGSHVFAKRLGIRSQ